MKLSKALKNCIRYKFYDLNAVHGSKFMCHALRNAGHREHVDAVMEMVRKIDPTSHALASALGIKRVGEQEFEELKAHYIKWIAKLKKEGK